MGRTRVFVRLGRRLLPPVILVLLAPAVNGSGVLASQEDPQCPRWRRAFVAMPTSTLTFETATRRRLLVSARVAATAEAQWAGFQCASPDEIRKTVILFDFGQEVQGDFHMQNVPAPLDIAFATGSGRIVAILRMDPSPRATYGPTAPYRYAIEARAGFFSEQGIAAGDTVRPEGPPVSRTRRKR